MRQDTKLFIIFCLLFTSTAVHGEESSRCIDESSEKTLAEAVVKCAIPNFDVTAETVFTAPVSALEEDTPVVHVEIAGNKSFSAARPWRAPNYKNQDKALGYSNEAFSVPKGMEKQVAFWKDIYTKYSTTQGVVHDAENIDLIYEVVDFNDIAQNKNLSQRAMEKQKQKRVEEIKKKYIAMLDKLSSITKVEDLTDANEKRIWTYFHNLNEPNEIKEASQKNRMRFQLGQKDRMQAAIFFSGRYLEDMEQIFKENNLPIELTRLAFVESSFNVLARSKVGASGIWQIMPYTARPYRYISATVDKRNSPIEATKLAVKLLRDNFKMLESWPLAVTGWNHGPTGVRRMTETYKTRNLVDLVENVRSRKSFGFASRNFYASFLAALEVERDASAYYKDVSWSQPLKAQTIKAPRTIKYKEILSWFDNNDEKLQVFNPHLTRQVKHYGWSIPAQTQLYVPSEKYAIVLKDLNGQDRQLANENEMKTESNDKKAAETYKVLRGDTLEGIAKAFGVSVKDLLANNEIESASKILPGQMLKIPR